MHSHFSCDSALLEKMNRTGKRNIVVEVATSIASDFEVSEIFLRLCRDEHAAYLCSKKRYRSCPCEGFHVILPPYHLEYDPEVHFGIRSFWIFRHMYFDGIRL